MKKAYEKKRNWFRSCFHEAACVKDTCAKDSCSLRHSGLSHKPLTKATVLQTPALHLEHNVHEQCFLISSKALSRFADFWVLQYEGGFEPQHPHDFKHCARNKVIQTASLSAVPLAMYYAADKVETDQKIQVRCGRQGRD